MKLTDLIITELDHEAEGSRKALQNVPEGKNDWKPHEKSMPLGYLATLVATIPGWIEMVIKTDEIDFNPPGGQRNKPPDWKTRADLTEQLEASVKKAKEALAGTTDEHLLHTKWRVLAGGKPIMEQTRYEAIREAMINHLAHHRGQLTVYLRLCGEKVPSIYGPSGDERLW